MKTLDNAQKIPFSKAVGNTLLILCAGLFAGVISKLLDIYT